ncbi:MAG: circularly permuted type 2 ATP-grasp protein [Moraxellaceae bacterium]|nr:circularly permuted type 2 ATP-grasp protein [Moraxellaceae bacterium]
MPQQLLAHYPPDDDRHDEMFAAAGSARGHYLRLYERLLAQTPPQLRALFGEVDRQIRDNGVTYNVYGDAQGADRPWNLDPLPLIIPAAEWREIERGVTQRATLFNRVLADLYGPQNLLREGRLPPSLLLGHPGYLRPMHGIEPAGGIFLHTYAVDLARSPDGHWWVIGDRTQAPSGAGYALENRLIVSRLLPDLFHDLKVRRLAGYFAAMRDSFEQLAPRNGEPCRTVLLTPGPYNETYFEHAYLARYLGFPLVEGHDLTVREGCVWLKTLSGLQRVHAIIRRLDDDYCDPLELRADSALGIPGLVEAIRRGNVMVANALGASVLESGALNGFMPGLCEHLLGEPLAIPNVATWWCGEAAAMEDALQQADHLVFKGAMPQRPFGPVFGDKLDTGRMDELARRVRSAPQDMVAQELVHLSRAPVLDREHGRRLLPRSVGLRVFAVATPQGYMVMPGGLARTSSQDDLRILSSQRGGGSKDVWVLGDEPPTQLSLLHRPVRSTDLVRSGAGLSSRVVENLFWFGRYTERCDNLARYLRVALARVVEDSEGSAAWQGIDTLGKRMGIIDAETTSRWAVPRQLVRAVTDVEMGAGLACHVQYLSRVGFSLRERLSLDNWRTLNALTARIARKPHNQMGVFEALAMLDDLINRFMTLSGFALDGMTRDHGWRFLSLGRRIERLQFQTRAIESAFAGSAEASPEWLLEVSDSIVTYRSRYLAQPEWLAVLDLLVRDESNPRALVFQSLGLTEYLSRLAGSLGPMPGKSLVDAHKMLLNLDPDVDLQHGSAALGELLHKMQGATADLSDELSLRFFSHVRSTRISA